MQFVYKIVRLNLTSVNTVQLLWRMSVMNEIKQKYCVSYSLGFMLFILILDIDTLQENGSVWPLLAVYF